MSQLEKNLVGVREHTPRTAERIIAAAIPAGYETVRGTDGAATFLRKGAELEWLGQTSMPSASAGGLVAALDTAGANGLGLSIGTGHEWKAFAKKLPGTKAVYVYEPEAGLLRMALTVCDLSAELEAGKIVLIGGGEEGELQDFLARHGGYDPPAVLHPLPTIEASRRNALLAAGEAIVRQGLAGRQELTARLIAEVGGIHGDGEPIALLTTATHAFERPLHARAEGSMSVYYLDRHDTASLAYRLELMARHRPREVLSDFFRSELGCLPAGIGVRTFVPPLAGRGFWQGRLPAAGTMAEQDRIVVHCPAHRSMLELQGIRKDLIELEPLRVRLPESARAGRKGGGRIVMVGDFPAIDVQSLGLELPTEQSVHGATVEMIEADYLNVTFGAAADILRRACLRAGVGAKEDQSVRAAGGGGRLASGGGEAAGGGLEQRMLRVIREVLIPAVPVVTLARRLLEQGLPLELVGHWAGFEASERCGLTGWRGWSEKADRWGDVAAVVHLSPWGNVSPAVLKAVEQGVTIVSPRQGSDGFAGSLVKLLEGWGGLLRPGAQQVVAAVKGLIGRG